MDQIFPSKNRIIDASPKKLVKIIGIILIVCLLLGFGYYFFQQRQKSQIIEGRFEIVPTLSDDAGIDPETSFIFLSSEDIAIKKLKKMIRFQPSIDFEIRKVNKAAKGGFLNQVLAAGSEEDSKVFRFEIKPQKPLETNTIYKIVLSKDYVEREYSWAYQVKAPFQVIATHPGDKKTNVPLNSGIEITFNREGFIDIEKYFSILPKTEGAIRSVGNKIVFVPQKLLPETIYRVTLKKGLKVKGSKDTLNKDYTFQFETGKEYYSSQFPYLSFNNDFLIFPSQTFPRFTVYCNKINSKVIEGEVYKFSSPEEFLESYQNSRDWSLDWTYYYRRKGTFYKPKEENKIFTFRPFEERGCGYSATITIPKKLEEGYYLLNLPVKSGYGEERRYQVWFQVVKPITHYSAVTKDNGIFWLADLSKKDFINGATISYICKGKDFALGTTDFKGFLQFDVPEACRAQEDNFSLNFFKIETKNLPPLFVKEKSSRSYFPLYYWQSGSEKNKYWGYISSDRPVYRPNDVLKYWGVVKGRNKDIRNFKVSVGIYKDWWYSRGEALTSQEVLVSSFDTIRGELRIEGIQPGYYILAVILDNELVDKVPIQILNYTKPTYQIEVIASKKAVVVGEVVNFKVKASFFDGTPVANLKVKYQIYNEGHSDTGYLTLNEFGEGVFSHKFSRKSEYLWSHYSFVEITVSPAGSEEGEIYGKESVLVFPSAIYLQTFKEKLDSGVYRLMAKVNKINFEDIKADGWGFIYEEYLGEPAVNATVKANINKITYKKIETGTYYDYITKTFRKTYRLEKEEELINSVQGFTDQKGEWSFNFDTNLFSFNEEGFYRIDFVAYDNKGKSSKESIYIWSTYYDDFETIKDTPRGSLIINNEAFRKEFNEGENIELKLKISGEGELSNSYILFYRYQKNIAKAEIVPSLSYQEKFAESFIPTMAYRAVFLSAYGFVDSNEVIASFDEETRRLSIRLDKDKENYRPGENVDLNIEVKDKNQKGVPSEVNVSVVDEALFHLPLSSYGLERDILKTLYKDFWISPVISYTSYSVVKSEGAEMGGCFLKSSKVLMADGTLKNIEDINPGDEILTWTNGKTKRWVKAVVQSVSNHWVREYIIINDFLKVTPEHKIFVNGRWTYAGDVKIGDKLLVMGGKTVIVKTVTKKTEEVPVYNIYVGKYHTYFVDGVYVHNEEKGGQPRMNFVDLAFYNTLKTDQHGKAHTSFKLPDNITSWRVITQAFSPQKLMAGREVSSINVSLPFFVEATINDKYLAGDSPIIRIRAFGTELNHNQGVEFQIESETLGLNKKIIAPNNFTYFSLGKLPEGEHQILISAKQGKYSDAIIKKFKVEKSYFKIDKSSFYKVSEGLSGIKGNQYGFTKLKFIDLGRGRFFSSLLRKMHNQGIRIDQVLGRYLAEKYLFEYYNEGRKRAESPNIDSYYGENGGLLLFPYGDEDLEITSKLSNLVPEIIYKERVIGYLYGALNDERADIHRISKALYGLSAFNELVLNKIQKIVKDPHLSLEDKTYLALGLVNFGDKETARKVYYNDIRNNLRFKGPEAWVEREKDLTKRVKLTGLIAALAAQLEEQDADKLGEYILTHNPERDLDILEELLYIKSELPRISAEKAEFEYYTNNRSGKVLLEKGKTYELNLSYEELKTLRFKNVKGNIALISFYQEAQDPKNIKKDSQLGVKREYLVNGVQKNTFNEGDLVLVRLHPYISDRALDGSYQIVDYLPSGLRPVSQVYNRGRYLGKCDILYYPTMMEGNTVYFKVWKGFRSDLIFCKDKTVNYYARVVSRGKFRANPAVIQSLKDLESLNVSSEDWIEIK